MNIYVGNLPYEATEENLKETFEVFGAVETVKVIKDNYTGRSKGFAFVEMPDGREAKEAIENVNLTDIAGRVQVACGLTPRRRIAEMPVWWNAAMERGLRVR